MSTMEKAALEHAAAWLRYRNSPQARRDAELDRARRAAADRKAGHLPACNFGGCAAGCGRALGPLFPAKGRASR